MSEYVVDAATALSALGRKDAEVGHVLRRGERAGEISEGSARTALRALPEMIDYRYPHTGRLADRAWDLRHTITFYDGLYVALAAMLDVPLLTGDVKLSKAPGLSCQMILIN